MNKRIILHLCLLYSIAASLTFCMVSCAGADKTETGSTYIKSVLHDFALTEKLVKDYKENGNPTSVVGSDGVQIALAEYNANSSLKSVTTNGGSYVVCKFSSPRIMCEKDKCADAETALSYLSELTGGTYDFKNNPAGIKAVFAALTSSVTYEEFSALINQSDLTQEMFNQYKSALGSGQTGAVIYGKNAAGELVGQYIFLNVGWFNSDGSESAYYCIDKSLLGFGEKQTAAYSDCYKYKP